ncbi:MAG TPA: hypothetical protein VLE22_15245 [Bryobacteraceae bacterium]|nr:hypothetical protein [Bryobacteraceae bacterium]
MRSCTALLVAGAVLPAALSAQTAKGCSLPAVSPIFNAANFSRPTVINNRHFPLVPGTTFVYESTRGKREHVEVVVTHDIKSILRVDCVVVRDTVSVGGEVVEDTFDFFAQDKDGNVWYMGEDTREFKKGLQVWTAGSWEAGANGATPGVIMEAHPLVRDAYRQENLPGEAEDMAQVLSLTASASVPYGSWEGNVLVTRECTPLEPKVAEEKYYALDVGLIRTVTVQGGSAESVLVAISQQ